MPTRKSIAGLRFGRVLVLSDDKVIGKGKSARRVCKCICVCGNEFETRCVSVKGGHTKSCGCWQIETLISRVRVHGQHRTPTYNSWIHMNERCSNPNDNRFKDYGGRGIQVCERWRHSFENFLSDMGEKPPGTFLDRINNNSGYEPSNCRWVTPKESNRNTRQNRILTFDGITGCVTELAEHFGFKSNVIFRRLQLGWSVEDTFKTALLRQRPQSAFLA